MAQSTGHGMVWVDQAELARLRDDGRCWRRLVEVPRCALSRAELVELDAGLWRLLVDSPEAAELMDQWLLWRREAAEKAASVEAGRELNEVGWYPGCGADLARRRRLVSQHPCGLCGVEVEFVHPLERVVLDRFAAGWDGVRYRDVAWVRCAGCAGSAR